MLQQRYSPVESRNEVKEAFLTQNMHSKYEETQTSFCTTRPAHHVCAVSGGAHVEYCSLIGRVVTCSMNS